MLSGLADGDQLQQTMANMSLSVENVSDFNNIDLVHDHAKLSLGEALAVCMAVFHDQ